MVSVMVASAYRKGSKGFQAAKPQRLPQSVPRRSPIGKPANDNIPLPKPANDNVPPLPVQIADMFGNARSPMRFLRYGRELYSLVQPLYGPSQLDPAFLATADSSCTFCVIGPRESATWTYWVSDGLPACSLPGILHCLGNQVGGPEGSLGAVPGGQPADDLILFRGEDTGPIPGTRMRLEEAYRWDNANRPAPGTIPTYTPLLNPQVWVAPSYYPAPGANPENLPIEWPSGAPQHGKPTARPAQRPWRDAGYAIKPYPGIYPTPFRPIPAPVPKHTPALVLGVRPSGGVSTKPGAKPGVRPGARPRSIGRPGKWTKEGKYAAGSAAGRKLLGMVVRAAQEAAHLTGEGLDMLDAIHNALPFKYRAKADAKNKRAATPQAKAMAIWKHFNKIDPTKMMWNIAANQVGDMIVGRMRGATNKAARDAGVTVGNPVAPGLYLN